MIKFNGNIEISETTEYTYAFYFKPDSSVGKDDGCIGAGRTVSAIDVTGYTQDGTTVTTYLISGTPSIAANIVYVKFKKPIGFPIGRYYIYMDITQDNGEKDRGFFEGIDVV